MSQLLKLLKAEYDSEYDLGKKKDFGKVSIYDAGGNLEARWYVYYSFRNPATGKLERQAPIYLNINDQETIRERRKAAKVVQESLEQILKSGFNPYEEEKPKSGSGKEIRMISIVKSCAESIDFALSIGKETFAETSYPDFKSRLTQFKVWLASQHMGDQPITDISPILIQDYLNTILKRSSPRNRNNTRIALSSMFTILKDNFIVPANIVEDINVLKSSPERNKSFTVDQEEKILDKIVQQYPALALFIGFVSINLLRPIEVVRLQVSDINLKDRQLTVRAKNQKVKTKIIPELLLKELPDLSRFNKSDYLFTPTGIGSWEATEVNRRNYFSDLFKKVKDDLGLGKDYGMYSFRHTYITKLYRALRQQYSPFESKSRLMHITGHGTMKALDAYLREIDAELPEDYSSLLSGNKKTTP